MFVIVKLRTLTVHVFFSPFVYPWRDSLWATRWVFLEKKNRGHLPVYLVYAHLRVLFSIHFLCCVYRLFIPVLTWSLEYILVMTVRFLVPLIPFDILIKINRKQYVSNMLKDENFIGFERKNAMMCKNMKKQECVFLLVSLSYISMYKIVHRKTSVYFFFVCQYQFTYNHTFILWRKCRSSFCKLRIYQSPFIHA